MSFVLLSHLPFYCKLRLKPFFPFFSVRKQILQIEDVTKTGIDSILFMGMGEPLLNYSNVVSALRALVDKNQFGYSRRKITVSTIGMIEQIEKLSNQINKLMDKLEVPNVTNNIIQNNNILAGGAL